MAGRRDQLMDEFLDQLLGELLADLAVHADPARAASEQAYLKSDREFLGVTVPVGRKVVRRLLVAHDIADHDTVVGLAAACWDLPLFEARRAAVEILVHRREVLVPDDLAMLQDMARTCETWALLDGLAAEAVGSVVTRYPADTGPVLDRWAADPDSLWVRRAALLSLLVPLRRGEGDWDRFCRYAEAMLDEREFFIRKAIGWVLRDTSRRRPELVRAWVEPRLDQMSGVTRREALKYL